MTPGTGPKLWRRWVCNLLLLDCVGVTDGTSAPAVQYACNHREQDSEEDSDERDEEADVHDHVEVGDGVVDDGCVCRAGPVVVADCGKQTATMGEPHTVGRMRGV